MDIKISKRLAKPDFQAEFLNVILTAAADPKLISFAGGLPNPSSFPIDALNEAAETVLREHGAVALQYNGAQGYLPLRKFICDRYKKKFDIDFDPEDIIITNGSQQALDLFTALMVDPGDEIMVENPSYLAALQTFHLYDPQIIPVKLNEDGIDCDELEKAVTEHNPKFIYVIPNFQNPTGLTYNEEIKEKAAEILKKTNCLVLEDNPYGELRFSGKAGKSFHNLLGDQCIMLGTFSKIVSPGMRIGWIACKHKELTQKLVEYKSTMDLHTNIFGQMVIEQFLQNVDLDEHVENARIVYKEKAELMMNCMEKYLPEGTTFTKPQGGMFLWVTLPEGIKAIEVFRAALKKGVAICPGDPFYEYERDVRTMRINYSNSTDEAIEKGIRILGETIKELM